MGRFTHQHRVSWPEVDLAGVVYFAHFVNYFEEAETEWVRSHGIEYGEMLERFGICMPRVSIHCDYHGPARLDDLLDTLCANILETLRSLKLVCRAEEDHA